MNIVAAGGMVYASSGVQVNGNSQTYAIDAESGKVVWRARGPYPVSAQADAVFGFEIVDGGKTNVVALDAAHGRTAWRYDAGRFLGYDKGGQFVSYAVNGWMACSGPMVYIASSTAPLSPAAGPAVRALDARTGREVWAASLHDAAQDPAVAGGVLYGNSDGRVVALNGTTGAPRWKSAYLANYLSGLEAVDGVVCGNAVDTSSSTTFFFALDGATGRQLWRGGGSLTGSADGIVFFTVWNDTDGASVSAYHARSGKRAWARSFATAGPLTAVGSVLYNADGATLTALAATTGDSVWSYRLDHEVWWLAVDDDVVYAGDAKGGVYALRPSG